MIQIDNILIDEDIVKAKFSCDLKKCKGACCTFPGEYGAPLLDSEIAQIEKALPEAKKYLSPKSLKVLEQDGFFEGSDGDYSTVCIDKKDCVLVFYEGDVAKCALEKAFFDGKAEFRKPISCHLFPIRVGSFGGSYLYYEKISECEPAKEKGKAEEIPLYESLKDSLTRSFGEKWYSKLDSYIKENIK